MPLPRGGIQLIYLFFNCFSMRFSPASSLPTPVCGFGNNYTFRLFTPWVNIMY
jgi:hypothetical protein